MSLLYLSLEKLLEQDETRKYAIFDFDRTCISNDIQEMIYVYQAKKFHYRISDETFKEITNISNHIKKTAPGIYDIAKKIEDDVIENYSSIYNKNYKKRDVNIYDLFYKGMLWLLEIANTYIGNHFNYQWVLKYLWNFEETEIINLASEAYKYNRQLLVRGILEQDEFLFTIDAKPTLRSGVDINNDILELMKYLKNLGVDIYILSASSQAAVLGVVEITDFASLISKDNIIAQKTSMKVTGEILPIDEGKEKIIRKDLQPKYGGKDPILIAGDSMGDFWMLNMLGEKSIRLLVGNNEKLKSKLKDSKMPYYTL